MSAKKRKAKVKRVTRETSIELTLDLDGGAGASIRTPVPFMNHMLELLAAHGGFSLAVRAGGDVDVDDHHLVEDLGISLGEALGKALGDKKGIRRYGQALMPMDEALVQVALDLSGRTCVKCGKLPAGKIKRFDVALVAEFLEGLGRGARLTLHTRVVSPGNLHHTVEALFKGLGRALGQAVEKDSRFKGVPSTKGRL